jgi:hypothetical protein
MATQKLIQLFEQVRTGTNCITTQNQNIAIENAKWFYNMSKKITSTITDLEVENDASQLINLILRNKAGLVQKFTDKINNIKTYKSSLKKGENKTPVPSLEALLGSFLKDKLEKHFKLIINPEEVTLLSKYQIALDSIKKLFPNWKNNECKTVLSIFYLRYSLYLKNDQNAIIDRITRVWEIAIKSKPNEPINPGYVITIIRRNNSLHNIDGDIKNIIFLEEYPIFEEFINSIIEAENINSSPKKVENFWNWIK